MKHPLEQLLDGCIAELNRGIDLESVLSAHPEVADELRPLLATAMTTMVDIPPPVRKAERKDAFLAQVAAHRRQVETTEGYVVELRAGVPLAELLARAPVAMRPLVLAAWRMVDTPAPTPAPEARQAGKQALMALAAARRAERSAAQSPTWLARLRLGFTGVLEAGGPFSGRPRRLASGALGASLAVLVLFAGASGVGSASASSLPGEPFYHVKRLGESAQLFFAFEPGRRAALNLEFTERRMQELARLSAAREEVPLAVIEDWLRAQSDAWADIQGLPAAERAVLLRSLAALVGDGEALETRLRDLVSDPAGLDALLKQSAGLARSLRPVPPPIEVATPELPARLQAAPVPPAAGESESGLSERPAPTVAPLQPPVVAPAPVASEPPSQSPSAPPVVAPPAEDPEEGRPEQPAVDPAVPGQPPVADPPPTEPVAPPIIVPPLEDPNGPEPPGGDQPAP